MNEQIVPRQLNAESPSSTGRPSPSQAGQRSEQKPRRSFLLGAVASLVVIALAAAAWWALGARTTVHYTTVPVTRGAITRTITATGTVNPELTIIVGTYVSGVIQELSCDYNTRVTRGQVCAKIDPRPYQSVVDQSKANLAVAKAQLEKDKAASTYAKLALDRAARLIETKAVSQDAYDNAKSAYEQAQAQIQFDEATIQQRQAALDAAQVNLDYTNIISPVDGTVVSRNVTVGQTVAASFQTPTLFLIATDLTKMQVDTNVSESDIGDIKTGDAATFTVDAYPKRNFDGKVSQVRQSPQTVQNVVTYDVVVSVDNSELALMPGMTAATRVVVDRREEALRVPNAALRFRPSGLGAAAESPSEQVFVLRDGTPVSVPIEVGLDDESHTEVVSGGLRPGDMVITAERSDTGSRTIMPRLRF
jgi:HlyD family secretion protein